MYRHMHANLLPPMSHRNSGQGSSQELLIGQSAPDFTLPDLKGQKQALSAKQGRTTALMFFCGCGRCHTAARKIAVQQKHGKLRSLVTVLALDSSAAREFQRETGLAGMILCDPSDTTAEIYRSTFCPRLWVVSPSGQIQYRSAYALEGADLADALQLAQKQTTES
jgi:peroxiredoxin